MGVDLSSATTVFLPTSAGQDAAEPDDISRQAEFLPISFLGMKNQSFLFSCFSLRMAWLCLAVTSGERHDSFLRRQDIAVSLSAFCFYRLMQSRISA